MIAVVQTDQYLAGNMPKEIANGEAAAIQQFWSEKADWSLVGTLELELAKLVAKFPEVLDLCIRDTTPHPMCAYALELANGFNAYYNHRSPDGKSDTSVKLTKQPGLKAARLALVVRVASAISQALEVLGIHAPKIMRGVHDPDLIIQLPSS